MGHSAEVENFPFLLEKFHFSGKFFHSSGLPSVPKFSPNEEIGKFSTLVENFPLPKICKKKNFFCRIAWIGTFCRGRKFSTFGGKFSTLAKFYFRVLDLRVCQIWAQRCKVEIFPLWWKIFHFQKVAKKKNFYSKITWIGSFCIEKFFPKNRKIFHFFQKLENSANLFLRAYSWTKFQRKIFSQKMGIQVVGFWAKNPNFQT